MRAHDAEEGDKNALQIFLVSEGFPERRLGDVAFVANTRELRTLGELGTHPDRDSKQDCRHEERNAPAPAIERLLADVRAGGDDHEQGCEQTEGCRRLDPACRCTALGIWCMLGDINCSAAIFAAERDPLEDTQDDEEGRARRP